MKTVTLAEWRESAKTLYGEDVKQWKFQCPICKGVQSLQDFKDAGISDPQDKFFFSCIGRWVKGRGCDWTLGGLLRVHETEVINEEGNPIAVFEFADNQPTPQDIEKQEIK